MRQTPSAIDLSLSEEQEMIQSAVAEFASDVVAPQHEALDHGAKHPQELVEQIAELGLFGVFLTEDEGGAGAGQVGHALVVETLARAAGLAGILPVAQGICTFALRGVDGASEQLEGLAAGEILGAPALSELYDDAVATKASGSGDQVTLTGVKANVPYPGRAGLYLVRAESDEGSVLAIVEPGAAGLKHGDPEPVLGLSGFEVANLHLENTPAKRIGGADALEALMTHCRIAVSAFLAGVSRGAVDHASRYSVERSQFKLELRRFGAIQERLVRADARTEALRSLTFGAAMLLDAGKDARHAASQARWVASDTAPSVTDDGVQVYGGFGYSREYPAERFYRDAAFPGFGEFHVAHELRTATAVLT